MIKEDVTSLVIALEKMQDTYVPLCADGRKEYYLLCVSDIITKK